jgi:hypothetical protein
VKIVLEGKEKIQKKFSSTFIEYQLTKVARRKGTRSGISG